MPQPPAADRGCGASGIKSWLDMAEIELGIVTEPRLVGRRYGVAVVLPRARREVHDERDHTGNDSQEQQRGIADEPGAYLTAAFAFKGSARSL